VKARRWKRDGRTFIYRDPGKLMAYVFGSDGRFPMWAWVVYRSLGTTSGVRQTLQAAKSEANKAIDEEIFHAANKRAEVVGAGACPGK
jgi:hypothetical protein